MKLSKKILFAQEGAPMPDPNTEPASQEAPAQDPNAQIQEAAGQLLDMLMQQIGDPQVVLMILQTAEQMIGQASAPAPTYQRNGGRMQRIYR